MLHNHTNVPFGKRMGPPVVGAVEGVERLLLNGHHLVVCTCRLNDEERRLVEMAPPTRPRNHVEKWLDFFHFPPLTVTHIKPIAHVYVDDRAYRFHGDWSLADHEINSLRPNGGI